jgi:hypothetical protein
MAQVTIACLGQCKINLLVAAPNWIWVQARGKGMTLRRVDPVLPRCHQQTGVPVGKVSQHVRQLCGIVSLVLIIALSLQYAGLLLRLRNKTWRYHTDILSRLKYQFIRAKNVLVINSKMLKLYYAIFGNLFLLEWQRRWCCQLDIEKTGKM